MNTLGYILGRIWSGNTSLAKLYWGYGVLGGIFWGVILHNVTPGSVEAIVACVLFTAFCILVSVGMWRAAAKYQGWFIWAGLARLASAFGIVQSFLLAGVLIFVLGETLATGVKSQQRNDLSPSISAFEPQKEIAMPATAPESQSQTQYVDPLDRELAIMDQAHPGWRQKVTSAEFSAWISRQDLATQMNYESAETAAKLSVFIAQFDRWVVEQRQMAMRTQAQVQVQKNQPPSDSPEKVDRILQQMSDWDNRHAQRLYEGRN